MILLILIYISLLGQQISTFQIVLIESKSFLQFIFQDEKGMKDSNHLLARHPCPLILKAFFCLKLFKWRIYSMLNLEVNAFKATKNISFRLLFTCLLLLNLIYHLTIVGSTLHLLHHPLSFLNLCHLPQRCIKILIWCIHFKMSYKKVQ